MSASKCSTCVHWSQEDAQNNWRFQIPLALLPDEKEEDRYKHDSPYQKRVARVESQFGVCSKISLLDAYDELDEVTVPLTFTKDASDYMATLYTQGDFGCVLHETKAAADAE